MRTNSHNINTSGMCLDSVLAFWFVGFAESHAWYARLAEIQKNNKKKQQMIWVWLAIWQPATNRLAAARWASTRRVRLIAAIRLIEDVICGDSVSDAPLRLLAVPEELLCFYCSVVFLRHTRFRQRKKPSIPQQPSVVPICVHEKDEGIMSYIFHLCCSHSGWLVQCSGSNTRTTKESNMIHDPKRFDPRYATTVKVNWRRLGVSKTEKRSKNDIKYEYDMRVRVCESELLLSNQNH